MLQSDEEDEMTKADFVKRVSNRTGMANAEAARAVQAFLDEVTDALAEGQEVQFAGFGKFSTSRRPARNGVNPRNPGERIQIPARTVPKFTPGATLKESVAG